PGMAVQVARALPDFARAQSGYKATRVLICSFGGVTFMRLWLRLSTAYLSCAVVMLALASAASAQTADLVFLNGNVFTADARSSIAEGFAIKDGRFIATGSSA